jgi:hypothetical protein
MGFFFSSKNNTVSDEKMADLKRRAQKADKESWVSKRAVDRRLRDQRQRQRSGWS